MFPLFLIFVFGFWSGSLASMASSDPITIEAEGSIEFDDMKNTMKAHDNVSLVQGQSTLWADIMHGFFKKENKKQSLTKLEAFGHVKIKMPDKIATAEEGFYDLEKDLVFLKRNVKITDKKNQLTGAYGTINLKTGQSRLFNTLEPISYKGIARKNQGGNRIKILLVPEKGERKR